MRKNASAIIMFIICLVTLFSVGTACVLRSSFLAENMGQKIAELASESLETKVQIGQVAVENVRSAGVKDIVVYDKAGEEIASVDYANVEFSLFSLLADNPLDGINQINVSGVKAHIVQREDGSFNVEDLISDEPSKNNYYGKIHVADAEADLHIDNKDISLEQLNADLDFAAYPTIRLVGEGINQGSIINVTGNIGGEDKTTITVKAKDIDVENYLSYIPEGTIPDIVTDIKGHIPGVEAAFIKIGQDVYYTGKLELTNGEAVVLDKKIENIRGLFMLDERKAMVFLNASCEDQLAAAHGNVLLNTGTPVLDIAVEAHNFDPGKILDNGEYEGGVNLVAHITGPADNPVVDGEVSVPHGMAEGYSFTDLSAKVHYADNKIYAKDISVNVFDGKVSGEAEFNAKEYSFVSHLKVSDVELAHIQDRVPTLSGKITGDLAFDGRVDDIENVNVYGSFSANRLAYGTLDGNNVESLHSSFAKKSNKIDIDFASAHMTGGGILGLSGSMIMGESMNLSFYGSNLDISQFAKNNPQLSLSGRMEIQGTAAGAFDNPIIRADVSAKNGDICHQKFDIMHGKIAGSLRGMKIDNFVLEHDDKIRWYINGQFGNRKNLDENPDGILGAFNPNDIGLNIRVDTVDARIEDLIKAAGADIPFTGSVDNVITVKGSLAEPDVTGYVELKNGNYNGIFMKRFAGDYYLKNNVLTLQDFRLESGWFDVQLNGTISDLRGKQELDLKVNTYDVDLERFKEKLQYPISGHARFDGKLIGTAVRPYFDGVLTSEAISINGEALAEAGGHLIYTDDIVTLERFGFVESGGKNGRYDVSGKFNLSTDEAKYSVLVDNASLGSILKMSCVENDKVDGHVNGKIIVDGDFTNAMEADFSDGTSFMNTIKSGVLDGINVNLNFTMNDGNVAGYNITNAKINMNLVDSVVTFDEVKADEGIDGVLDISGRVNLKENLNASVSVKNIDVGMFTKLAGIDNDVTGKINLTAKGSGSIDNPSAKADLSIDNPGIPGVAIDDIVGEFSLDNGIIAIKKLRGEKKVILGKKENIYYATAEGTIPIAALSDEEEKSKNSSMNVLLSLDDADLSMLPGLNKSIEWAVGELDGRIRITGNRLHPGMNGSIKIHGIPDDKGNYAENAVLKIAGLNNPIEDMYALITFNGNVIHIDSFDGKIGGGTYKSNGDIVIDGSGLKDYNISFKADKLGINSKVFTGNVDLDLNVAKTTGERLWNLWMESEKKRKEEEQKNTEEGQKDEKNSSDEPIKRPPPPASPREIPDLPLIVGNMNIDNAIISIPNFESNDDPLPNLFFNFNLNLGNNVRFYVSQMANLQLEGGAHLFGSTKHPRSSGSIKCRKGTVSYLKTNFKLREAEIRFDQVNSLLPSIKLFAETKISKTRVYLYMNGPLYGNTNLMLKSEPSMNEADIIKFLTLRTEYTPGGKNDDMAAATSMATMALQMALLGEIEDSMRNSLGLDLFTVERDSTTVKNEAAVGDGATSSNKEIYNVTLGKNITDNIMLKGSKSVNSNDYNVKLEYEFNDRYSMSLGKDKDNSFILGFETTISF